MGLTDGSVVKKPPAVQETQVWFLDQEDPLQEEMATHSSIVAREIQWTKKPGSLQYIGWQKSWRGLSD